MTWRALSISPYDLGMPLLHRRRLMRAIAVIREAVIAEL